MAIEVKQRGTLPVPCKSYSAIDFGIDCDAVRGVRQMFGSPDIVQIVRGVTTRHAQIRNDRAVGTKLVFREIYRINRLLYTANLRQSDQLVTDIVRGTAEFPRIDHVTDQLPLVRITWARVNAHFSERVGIAHPEIRSQDLVPKRFIAARNNPAAVICIHQQSEPHW